MSSIVKPSSANVIRTEKHPPDEAVVVAVVGSETQQSPEDVVIVMVADDDDDDDDGEHQQQEAICHEGSTNLSSVIDIEPGDEPLGDLTRSSDHHHVNNNPLKSAVHHGIAKITNMLTTTSASLISYCFGTDTREFFRGYEWIRMAVLVTQTCAIISMILGLYQCQKHPRVSVWSQRFGHFLCLGGLFLMAAPALKLPSPFIPVPLLLLALLLLYSY